MRILIALLVTAAMSSSAAAQTKPLKVADLARSAAGDISVPARGRLAIDGTRTRRGLHRVAVQNASELVELGLLPKLQDKELADLVTAASGPADKFIEKLNPLLSKTTKLAKNSKYAATVQTLLRRVGQKEFSTLTTMKVRALKLGDGARLSIRGVDIVVVEDATLGADTHFDLASSSTLVRFTRTLSLSTASTGTACVCLTSFHSDGPPGSDGGNGTLGNEGGKGSSGANANCGYLDDTCATSGGKGGKGGGGQFGGPGGNGAPGSNVILDFRALTTSPSGVCVFTNGGAGGKGGTGGKGGKGGKGGTGGDGKGCEYGAKGGKGGTGGDGGDGGEGGDGGAGGDIAVFVGNIPPCLQTFNAAGAGGAGGQPGAGGDGGEGGKAGATTGDFWADDSCDSPPKASSAGDPGKSGKPGVSGQPGSGGATAQVFGGT